MTNIPTRYIHGNPTDILGQFAASALEVTFHLEEALKAMGMCLAYMEDSKAVKEDLRSRDVNVEYCYRLLEAQRGMIRENKTGFDTMMHGVVHQSPSVLSAQPKPGEMTFQTMMQQDDKVVPINGKVHDLS